MKPDIELFRVLMNSAVEQEVSQFHCPRALSTNAFWREVNDPEATGLGACNAGL